ncbi:MAG: hypothetical protein Kow0088_21270 [Anaerolineales bacterium]
MTCNPHKHYFSVHLKGYGHSKTGAYRVTITLGRACLFGELVDVKGTVEITHAMEESWCI